MQIQIERPDDSIVKIMRFIRDGGPKGTVFEQMNDKGSEGVYICGATEANLAYYFSGEVIRRAWLIGLIALKSAPSYRSMSKDNPPEWGLTTLGQAVLSAIDREDDNG